MALQKHETDLPLSRVYQVHQEKLENSSYQYYEKGDINQHRAYEHKQLNFLPSFAILIVKTWQENYKKTIYQEYKRQKL